MRKNLFLLSIALLTSMMAVAVSPKREFRSVWLTTAASIDWPKNKAKTESGRKAQQVGLVRYMQNGLFQQV